MRARFVACAAYCCVAGYAMLALLVFAVEDAHRVRAIHYPELFDTPTASATDYTTPPPVSDAGAADFKFLLFLLALAAVTVFAATQLGDYLGPVVDDTAARLGSLIGIPTGP